MSKVMIVHCDLCNALMDKQTNQHQQSIKINKSEFKLFISVVDTTGTVSDVCKYCLIDLVNKLDYRPAIGEKNETTC